uniref:Uncharacterized protein n=1 Tax=Arundo donax TaxID=35708 RepID=A0A0A8Y3E8_ARUDO
MMKEAPSLSDEKGQVPMAAATFGREETQASAVKLWRR